MLAFQTMGRNFQKAQTRQRDVQIYFRGVGIAIICHMYSKPQTDERRDRQSTSGFLCSATKFGLRAIYCTFAITKLLAVKNCAWPVGGVKAPVVGSIEYTLIEFPI